MNLKSAAPSAAPWGRLLLTAALPLGLCAAQQIVLPGLDGDQFHFVQQLAGTASSSAMVSVVALGLAPVMSGFLLTELAAAIVPQWRRLRSGELAARQQLLRAALVVSLLLALVQGFLIARWLIGASLISGRGGLGLDMIAPDAGVFVPLATLTLAAGTCALLALARVIDRYALGGGLSLLILTLALRRAVDLLQAPSTGAALLDHSGPELVRGGCLVLAVFLAVTLALQRSIGAARGAPVRLPTSGLVPLTLAATALVLPGQVAAYLHAPLPDWLAQLTPGEAGYWGAYAALVAALGLLLARLFSWPERASDADRRTLVIATLWSLALLAVIAVGNALVPTLLGVALELVVLTALPAVLLDVAAEWRLRRTHGPLLHVWTCAHLPAASSVLMRLAAAGIPAVVRSLHHRSLWHIYAPYIEMDVLVPLEQATYAHELLSGVATPEQPDQVARHPATPLRSSPVVWALGGVVLLGLGSFAAERTALLGNRPTFRLSYQAAAQPQAEDASYVLAQSPESALQQDAEVLNRRLAQLGVHGATARVDGKQLLVELPDLPLAERARLQVLLGRRGQLTFRLIADGDDYLRQLGLYADAQRARFPGLEVGYNAWTSHASGTQFTEVFLKADAPEVIKQFLAQLPPELMPPPGLSLLLQRTYRPADEGTHFRTYLVAHDAPLTDHDIAAAEITWDTSTMRPEVALTFTAAAASRFEQLTAAHVGHRLAIVLDNTINSVPIIEGRIAGGRARINLGGFESTEQLRQEARDLVAILRAGSLPLPLVFAREERLDGKASELLP